MFAAGRESQTEIFGYNTKSVTFLKKLGKLTNWLKSMLFVLKLQKYSKFCVGIKNHYFQSSISSKHFLKKIIKREKNSHCII